MMRIWAVIPVKTLQSTKSRLSGILSPAQRADLTHQLLQQTLGSLQQVSVISDIVVVSHDEAVARVATAHHARIVAEKVGDGLNEAVSLGQAVAAAHGSELILVLPSDLPFMQVTDIERFLEGCETAVTPFIICSDHHHQGTNAMLLPAPLKFKFQYGTNSYHHHLAEAKRHQLHIHKRSIPGLQFDIDTELDWHHYRGRLHHWAL